MNPTVYVHDLDPVIWQITDSIALRWYGLAYLMGFIGGYYLLSWLSRRKLYPVPQDKMSDFVTYVAIFGVLIGGRLGYVLFYQIPNHGWSQFLADPLMVLRVWEGGMASHGGMIGVGLYTFYYAWKHRVKWVALLDGLAIVAPVGLFFGRMANFINGELYGRVVPPGSSQGMIFPAELSQDPDLFVRVASRIYETPGLLDKLSLSGIAVPERMTAAWVTDRVRDTPAIREIVGRMMQDHARYPSQLYEAFAEGVLLFAVVCTGKVPSCVERLVLRYLCRSLCCGQNYLRRVPGAGFPLLHGIDPRAVPLRFPRAGGRRFLRICLQGQADGSGMRFL